MPRAPSSLRARAAAALPSRARWALRLGLAGLLLAAGCGGEPPPTGVVLVTLDTTRPDHLGLYGYRSPTSPHLDRFAEDADVYLRAFSTSSWTLPAHASLFTGKLTSSHGARYDAQGPLALSGAIEGPRALRNYRARALSPSATTLAEILRDAGYATGAVVGGPWMKRTFGLAQGFSDYDDRHVTRLAGARATVVSDGAIGWLEENADRSFFLFLNYFDPHGPYTPPEPFRKLFLDEAPDYEDLSDAEQRKLYDGEIRYMDQELGRVLAHLRERGLYDSSWVVVTADHGELLGEHDQFGHGFSLSQPEIRIPLLVKPPGVRAGGARHEAPVQLTDVLPTLLEGLGIPVPRSAGLQGERLPDVEHPIVAELYPVPAASRSGDWRVLVEDHLKFAWNGHGDHALYDLREDPGERVNLYERRAERARRMHARLQGYLAGLPAPRGRPGPVRTVDEETRRALERLGYLERGGGTPEAAPERATPDASP